MSGLVSLVKRELQVGSRERGLFRGRVMMAGLVMFVFVAVTLAQRNAPITALGPMALGLISTVLIIYAFFAGVRQTADCLSREKREGTLGLLFLTELTSVEVALAKFVSASVRSIYGMLATLPVLALCILLGGVTGWGALQLAMTLLTMLWFSLALGLFVSSVRYDEKSVLLETVGLLLFFFVGLPVLWKGLDYLLGGYVPVDWILYGSPGYLSSIPATTVSNPEYWRTLATVWTISFLFVGGTAVALTRWLRAAAPIQTEKKQRTKAGRAKIDEANPYRWLLLRDRTLPRTLRFCAAGTLILAVVSMMNGTVGPMFSVLIQFLYAAHVIVKLLVGAAAVRQLNEDRTNGTLELLLSTPLEPNLILRSQVWYALRISWIAMVPLVVANLFALSRSPFDDAPALMIGGALMLFLDSITIAWWTLRDIMHGKRYPSAIARSFVLVIVVPLAAILLYNMSQGGGTISSLNRRVGIWLAIAAIYDFFLIHLARRSLDDMRALAAVVGEGGGERSG